QPDRAEMPVFDFISEQPAAVAVGRQCVELAGTAVGTIAVAELRPFDAPFDRHRRLPALRHEAANSMRGPADREKPNSAGSAQQPGFGSASMSSSLARIA